MARKRYNFWLDEKNPGDWALNDLIARLKKPAKGPGQFTRAIREGVRLWDAFQKRDVKFIVDMAPWLVEAIRKLYPSGDEDLRRELADMKQLIIQQGSIGAPPKDYPVMKPVTLPIAPAGVVKQVAADLNAIGDDFMAFIQ